MHNTVSIFEDRKRELELYYSIMLDIDSGKPTIKTIDNMAFFKILKSNFILMLYNLIEACVVSGILEIYEELKQDGCSYNDVIDEVKTIWRNRQIANVYQQTAPKATYERKVEEIVEDITNNVPIILTREELRGLGGNLDDKKIMKFCDKHRIRYVNSGGGQNMGLIKQKRNDLAHGDVSFSDCARDFTIKDLYDIKDDVIQFMQSIIDGMQKYYDEHGYRICSGKS